MTLRKHTKLEEYDEKEIDVDRDSGATSEATQVEGLVGGREPAANIDVDLMKENYQAGLGEPFEKSGSRLLAKKEFETTTEITTRVLDISGAFGLGVDDAKRFAIFDDLGLRIAPSDVVYITGDSGSGKSTLLRYLAEVLAKKPEYSPVLRGEEITIDRDKTLIDSLGSTTDEAINILTHVGLNDAFIFLRKFDELSDGQKYRYRLARAIDANAKTLVFDEFCSVLDRTTARVVSYLMQKLARRRGITLVLATSHDDLMSDVHPSLFIRKSFGNKAHVAYASHDDPECSLASIVKIVEGDISDYESLKEFHYRAEAPPFTKRVFKMLLGDETIGVIVYTTTIFMLANRNVAMPKLKEMYAQDQKLYMAFLNANFLRISRVVMHPRVRGIGLAVKLVRETMPLTKKRYIETIAAMARFNPFFEHAGMTRFDRDDQSDVTLTKKWEKCLADLQALGCDVDYIRSKTRNKEWLMSLSNEKFDVVRKILKSHFTMHHAEQLARISDVDGIADIMRSIPSPMTYYLWTNESMQEVANQEYLREHYEDASLNEQSIDTSVIDRVDDRVNDESELARLLETEAKRLG